MQPTNTIRFIALDFIWSHNKTIETAYYGLFDARKLTNDIVRYFISYFYQQLISGAPLTTPRPSRNLHFFNLQASDAVKNISI